MLQALRDRHPGSSVLGVIFFDVCRLTSALVLKLGFGLTTHNIERVPRSGPLLIVSNHQSYLDPPIVGCRVRGRQLDFLARDTLFAGPISSRFFRGLHCIPVSRGDADVGSLKECLARLKNGCAVLIFPEGTRSADGEIQPFKRGVSLMIKRAKCPVLPAAIEGADTAWPRGGKPRPFRHKIHVAYGEPIEHADLIKDGPDRAIERLEHEVRALQAELRSKIGHDEGQGAPEA
ncbi:MAG: lysophospholipid acyltransferase family protein [Planctomycetota bacterium]